MAERRGGSGSATGPKSWTLPAAREMLRDVRARTERAVNESERLTTQRDALPEQARERSALEERIQLVVERWAAEMEGLGVEVKGLWLVDFDNGNGYYCWTWPEEDVEFFHGYEEGFAGRIRIQ